MKIIEFRSPSENDVFLPCFLALTAWLTQTVILLFGFKYLPTHIAIGFSVVWSFVQLALYIFIFVIVGAFLLRKKFKAFLISFLTVVSALGLVQYLDTKLVPKKAAAISNGLFSTLQSRIQKQKVKQADVVAPYPASQLTKVALKEILKAPVVDWGLYAYSEAERKNARDQLKLLFEGNESVGRMGPTASAALRNFFLFGYSTETGLITSDTLELIKLMIPEGKIEHAKDVAEYETNLAAGKMVLRPPPWLLIYVRNVFAPEGPLLMIDWLASAPSQSLYSISIYFKTPLSEIDQMTYKPPFGAPLSARLAKDKWIASATACQSAIQELIKVQKLSNDDFSKANDTLSTLKLFLATN